MRDQLTGAQRYRNETYSWWLEVVVRFRVTDDCTVSTVGTQLYRHTQCAERFAYKSLAIVRRAHASHSATPWERHNRVAENCVLAVFQLSVPLSPLSPSSPRSASVNLFSIVPSVVLDGLLYVFSDDSRVWHSAFCEHLVGFGGGGETARQPLPYSEFALHTPPNTLPVWRRALSAFRPHFSGAW